MIPVVSAGRKQTVLRTIIGKTATQITIDQALPAVPAAGDVMRPGSPNAQDLLDAIYDYFDGIGPGIGIAGVDRHPDPGELWPGILRIGRLAAALLAVDGVDDCLITAPAGAVIANVQEILVPGLITITFL